MTTALHLCLLGFTLVAVVSSSPVSDKQTVIDEIDIFEGDIRMDSETRQLVKEHYTTFKDAAAAADVQRGAGNRLAIRLWESYTDSDGNFVVPYILDSSLNSDARTAIEQSAADFAEFTCIRLVPRTNEQYYINYIADRGCYSPIGMRTSNHQVSIGSGCEHKGIAIHETMHSLGFWHEQSRPDRDSYVTIHWGNIRDGMDFNFEKRDEDDIDSMGSPYDISSVMHYQSTAFSTNGQRTISTVDGQDYEAQRDGFAQTDIDQINALYGCGTIVPPTTTTPVTTPAPTTTAPVTPITLPELQCDSPDLLHKRACMYLSQTADCTGLFMNQYCCQSCKSLGGVVYPPAPCNDRDYRCRAHAARGFCERIPSMMAELCPRTCGLC